MAVKDQQDRQQITRTAKPTDLKPRLHWFHWLVIASSLVLTLTAWYITKQTTTEKIQIKFDRESEQVVSLVKERMKQYEDALWGGAAYIAAVNNQLTHRDWAIYASNLSLEQKYPGINGIGIIYAMPSTSLPAFQRKHQQSRPSFKAYPKHDQTISMPITYIEPVSNNQQAVGLDMAHEANRFTAAKKARDTGTAQITGPIILVQDSEKTPGFLFYVPFYKTHHLGSSTLRNEDFLGLVYAPFIVKKLMSGVLEEQRRLVAIRITDTGETIYDELQKNGHREKMIGPYHKKITERMYGRTWTFDINARPMFMAHTGNHQPLIILITGIVIDALLLFVFIILARSNQKAITYAQKVTHKIKQTNRALSTLAHFDPITELPNRNHFIERLTETIESGCKQNKLFAICLLDIDNFKQINDNMGHAAGDALLQVLTKRLLETAEHDHHLSRMGGDEFALIIEYKSEDKLKETLGQYLSAAQEPFKIDKSKVHISISMGVVLCPEGGKTQGELIGNADIAMYQAKSKGKNTIEFFNQDISDQIKKRHSLDTAMREAIKNDEFYLVYQPQIDLSTMEWIGTEVLLRWNNPDLGKLLPMDFIPVAENNGMIHEISQWALSQACQDIAHLNGKSDRPPIKLAFNISIKELESKGFAEFIEKTLSAHNIPPETVSLEITESLMMGNIKPITHAMATIKKIGVQFALDDFGTGYSSMQYLKTLSFSTLKIDKTFVNDITTDDNDAVIVKATIQMAKGLGMTVLAEGVETKEQLEYLREHKCDQAQGYYFSKPIRASELIKWYENRKT